MRNNDPMAMLAYSEAQQGVEDLHSLHLLPLPLMNEHSSEEDRNKFRQTLLSNIQGLQRQLLVYKFLIKLTDVHYYSFPIFMD